MNMGPAPPRLFFARRRRRLYGLSEQSRSIMLVKGAVRAAIVLAALYLGGGWLLGILGVGNPLESRPALLTLEDGGLVNVSIEGDDWQRAENGMKLHPRDKVSTGGAAKAQLQFFDGTWIRLAQATDVLLLESTEGPRESELKVEHLGGTIWISVPPASVFSGSIIREVRSPAFTLLLPPRTDALLAGLTLTVFSASGPGITVRTGGHPPIVVGEGQRLELPSSGELGADLYTYRSPLDLLTLRSQFVKENRALRSHLFAKRGQGEIAPREVGPTDDDFLVLRAPKNDTTIADATIRVTGSIGPEVTAVSVNGHPAVIDATTLTFSQELAPQDGLTDIAIIVQAFDASKRLLAEARRRVNRAAPTGGASALPPPAITSPAKDGEVFRTEREEIVLRGVTPPGAIGITVNGYRLQLFDPSKGTWSYVAALRLGNLKSGTNTYDVLSLFEGGKTSGPVRLTVLWGPGQEGVVPAQEFTLITAPLSELLPQNSPLLPGSIEIRGVASDPGVIVSGTGFILEGTASSGTENMWVNDYRLQLYKAGSETWNYIASPDLRNLRRGRNVFRIVARNGKGEILDRKEVEVEYRP